MSWKKVSNNTLTTNWLASLPPSNNTCHPPTHASLNYLKIDDHPTHHHRPTSLSSWRHPASMFLDSTTKESNIGFTKSTNFLTPPTSTRILPHCGVVPSRRWSLLMVPMDGKKCFQSATRRVLSEKFKNILAPPYMKIHWDVFLSWSKESR